MIKMNRLGLYRKNRVLLAYCGCPSNLRCLLSPIRQEQSRQEIHSESSHTKLEDWLNTCSIDDAKRLIVGHVCCFMRSRDYLVAGFWMCHRQPGSNPILVQIWVGEVRPDNHPGFESSGDQIPRANEHRRSAAQWTSNHRQDKCGL